MKIAPEPQVAEAAWLDLIREESSVEIARRLGITDRQVRRINAKADRKHKKEDRSLCPTAR